MAKFHILLAALFLILVLPARAQFEEEEGTYYDVTYKHRLFTGGSLGFQFGSVIMIDVSPQIGYYLLEHISVGAGFTYQYISDRRWTPRYDLNVYGGRAFTRLYLPIFESIFGHLEYEFMAYRTNFYTSGPMETITLHNFLAGAGYRQSIGGISSINLMVLWNFNESEYALSSNPVIRVGVDIGL